MKQDFYKTLPTLANGAAVTVASTERGPCNKYGGGVSQIRAELAIGKDSIPVQDYDAIIFCGANTTEFQGEATAELIREFVGRGKLVTAICKGQEVLAQHGYFRKDLRVARSEYLRGQYAEHGCAAENTPAIRDGNFITGQDDEAGPAFAKLVLDAIAQRNR